MKLKWDSVKDYINSRRKVKIEELDTYEKDGWTILKKDKKE